jgi:hypothetical protein
VTIRQSSGTKGASSSLTLFTLSHADYISRIRCFLRSVDTDGLLQPAISTSVSVDARASVGAYRRIARMIVSLAPPTDRKTIATWGSCPARPSQSASYPRHRHPPHRAAPMTRSCGQQIWGEGVQSKTTRTIHLSFKGRVGSPCHIRGPPTFVAFGQPLAAAAAIRLIARGAQPPVRDNQLAAALKRGGNQFN